MEEEMSQEGAAVVAFPRLRRKPDVTIVVGGEEFDHHATMLCAQSEFFDAMLNSPMKEADELRVELGGDWDPEEWKEVSKFFDSSLAHSPQAPTVTKENIRMLLPWFQYLQMPNLLQTSESCLRDMTLCSTGGLCSRKIDNLAPVAVGGFPKTHPHLVRLQAEALELSEALAMCASFGFENLKKDIGGKLVQIIDESPDLFTVESIRMILSALADYGTECDTMSSIWRVLEKYLPAGVHESFGHNLGSILDNQLLAFLVHESMSRYTYALISNKPEGLVRQWGAFENRPAPTAFGVFGGPPPPNNHGQDGGNFGAPRPRFQFG